MNRAIGVGLAVAVGLGLTRAMAQAKRDYDKEMTAALTAAKDAAGFEWLGTLNRLCVLPPSNGAPSNADVAPGFVTDPKTVPPRDTWYADPVKVADDFYWLGGTLHSAWGYRD